MVGESSQHLAVVGEDAVDLCLHVSELRVDGSTQPSAGLDQIARTMQQIYECCLQANTESMPVRYDNTRQQEPMHVVLAEYVKTNSQAATHTGMQAFPQFSQPKPSGILRNGNKCRRLIKYKEKAKVCVPAAARRLPVHGP